MPFFWFFDLDLILKYKFYGMLSGASFFLCVRCSPWSKVRNLVIYALTFQLEGPSYHDVTSQCFSILVLPSNHIHFFSFVPTYSATFFITTLRFGYLTTFAVVKISHAASRQVFHFYLVPTWVVVGFSASCSTMWKLENNYLNDNSTGTYHYLIYPKPVGGLDTTNVENFAISMAGPNIPMSRSRWEHVQTIFIQASNASMRVENNQQELHLIACWCIVIANLQRCWRQWHLEYVS